MAIVKKNNDLLFLFISYILILAGRILLYHMIGLEGLSYYAVGAELSMLLGGMLCYSLQEASASLIRYRIRREQYKNAGKVFQGALFGAVLWGVFLMVLFQLACNWLVADRMELSLAVMGVRITLLAIPFLAVSGVLRGYFQGHLMRAPGVHANFIFAAVFLIADCISGKWWMLYGEKVAGLLHHERFQYAYGAIGAGMGLVIATIVSCLYLLVLYLVFHKSLERSGFRESSRNAEGKMQIFRIMTGSFGFYALYFLVFHASDFVGVVSYFLVQKGTEQSIAEYGLYYAGCGVFLPVFLLVFSAFFYVSVRKVAYYQERDDSRMARERLGVLLHHGIAIVMLTAVFLAVFSEDFLQILFGTQGTVLTAAMQIVCVALVFGAVAIWLLLIEVRMQKSMVVVAAGGIAMVLQLIVMLLLMNFGMHAPVALAIGSLVFYVVLATECFLLVSRELQYHQDWMNGVAIPAAAAAVSGILVLCLHKALHQVVGRELSLILCLVLGSCIDLVFLLLLKNLKEDELSGSITGRLIGKVAKLLHFFS